MATCGDCGVKISRERHKRCQKCFGIWQKSNLPVQCKKTGWHHTEETRKKMSLARNGKKLSLEHCKNISEEHKLAKRKPPVRKNLYLSEETKEKIRQTKLGSKNPNWKGGITPEVNKLRLLPEYKAWRLAVFVRDNWTCVWCGVRSKAGARVTICADHIKPFAYFPELRHELSNGRTLCMECHKKTDTYLNKAARKYRIMV